MMNGNENIDIENYIISQLLEGYNPQYERAYNTLRYRWHEDPSNRNYQSITDEIGNFQFNSEFIKKIEEYIDQKNLEPAQKIFLTGFVSNLHDKYKLFIIKLKEVFDSNDLDIEKLQYFINDASQCIDDLKKELWTLAIELIKSDKRENLKLIIKEIDFSETKMTLLREAMKYGRVEIVKDLLNGDVLQYTPQDVLNLHRFSEYKETTIEIIDILTESTKDTPQYYSAIYHKAMYYQYGNKQYLDVITSIDEIKTHLNNEYKESVAAYYQGLCYLYTGDIVNAKNTFESIQIPEGDNANLAGFEYLKSSIKNNLESSRIREGYSADLIERLQKCTTDATGLPIISENTKDALQSVLLNLKVRVKRDEKSNSNNDAKDQLLKFKYIELKKYEPKLAMILQFSEVKEKLIKQYYQDNTEEAEQVLSFLNRSFAVCEEGFSLLGLTPELIVD